jgi:hypothetical protein
MKVFADAQPLVLLVRSDDAVGDHDGGRSGVERVPSFSQVVDEHDCDDGKIQVAVIAQVAGPSSVITNGPLSPLEPTGGNRIATGWLKVMS